ncbi:hypothetical protein BGX38DRAFT_1280133 [Terfezia claveryi]|nr:hypothetical protein BGX38DRAFT_1280133 [Terfezia claveryi]
MTKLLQSKYIRLEQLKIGNVIGDPESGYEYVSRDDPEGVSNYILGKRMVAAISSRLEETALKWWEDYNSSKGMLTSIVGERTKRWRALPGMVFQREW